MRRDWTVLSAGFAVLVTVWAGPALAIGVQVPYSGQLAVNGELVNGTRLMRFQIVGTGCPAAGCYDSGAAGINVTVSNGAFSVLLGGSGLPALDSSVFGTLGRKLRVTVAGTVLTPDVDLPFSPYAAGGDHATLQNLASGDPHTQYFERDGSDPLGGNLNLGAHSIINGAAATFSGSLAAGSGNFSGSVAATTLATSSTAANSLDVAGGITAGSGNVPIVGADGRVPSINSTTFANLSGGNLTGLNGSSITSGTVDEARLDSNWTTKGLTIAGTGAFLNFGATSAAAPSDASLGWRLKLFDSGSAGGDYGFGIASFDLWAASAGNFSFRPGGGYTEKVTIHSSGKVGIGTNSPQSELQVASGYVQIPTRTTSAPPGTDCDNAAEAGRMVARTDTQQLYICMGAGGWVAK